MKLNISIEFKNTPSTDIANERLQDETVEEVGRQIVEGFTEGEVNFYDADEGVDYPGYWNLYKD